MSFEAEQALRPELGGGDRLLWSGRPRQGVRLRSADALMIPFSLVWGGFAVFWEYSVVTSIKAPLFFTLWGLPFVAVGLFLIFGRFFADSAARARTYYGLTDQRVIIVSGLRSRQVKSLDLGGLKDLSLSERSDCSGTISFGAGAAPFGSLGSWPRSTWIGAGNRLAPAFDMVEDARRVYELIRQAQRAAARHEA